ncbi:MAG: nicotinate (nicotinamide) nucleotide adenylyltransferase [Candidatus Krumholzibacteriota bacterium]|nr:nicotinate (nicotinamide) nucleotide adenylyltransferase [Candidatus Krumholzibacteriota bacterium]
MNNGGKIGLFGGSFDPIHTGHLILAEAALDFIGLDRVLFIPNAAPPHKRSSRLTAFDLRRRMIELAIEDNESFEISLLENRPRASFSYESIEIFRRRGYRREQLHFLVGSDSLRDIYSWKNPEIIFSHATIVSMHRPGYEDIGNLPAGAAVIMMDRGSNTISSSEIRKLVSAGLSIRYLVPRAVESFIRENSLYRERDG